jgi:16S rRNA (uracil1498-N3)-methyltransferase
LNLFYLPDISDGHLQLDEDESQHVLKVLRYQVGDELPVTDGKGNLYFCSIDSTAGRTCTLGIIRNEFKRKPDHHIHIALAPTKSSDRTEWFVEKATEIGIQEITFMQTHHSERSRINTERMQRVAISAMKQSGQVWLPEVHALTDFKSVLRIDADQKFIATVDTEIQSTHLIHQALRQKRYLILIGPEGDFSQVEIHEAIKSEFKQINLGVNVLRTETAALAACHTLNLLNIP